MSLRYVSALVVLLTVSCVATFAADAGTALVRHAPVLNGDIDGSVQQMLGESATLNGSATVTGDLLVPGSPSVVLNGRPTYSGTIDGTGTATPSNYQVIINGNASLRHVIRRTNAVGLPVVSAPPTPAGTRSVSLNNAGQSAGDFSTLKNLTLNGNVGQITVPGGVYGDFTANGNSGFTLGVAGATTASVYAFQHLTLNGNSKLNVVGPVVVTIANALVLNGAVGSSTHPEWTTVKLSSGGVTLNGNVTLYGYVVAPSGTVIINGQSLLAGGCISDGLTINGNGTLRLIVPVVNQPPVVSMTAPANGSTYIAPAAFALTAAASDPDGTISKVEFYQGTTKLGESATAPYSLALTGVGPGNYSYTARAIDNSNASTDSAPVTVTVGANQPPTVTLTSPTNGASLVAPATVNLVANAADSDGTVAKVEFYQNGLKIGESSTAPYQLSVPALGIGTYTFVARATDNGNASTNSATVTISVVSPPNQPPVVSITAPASGTSFFAPATVNLVASASDPDGSVAQVEFFQNGVNVGATSVSPYQFSVSGLAAGSYSFTARATDNVGAKTDSAAISVTVVGVNQPPAVTLTQPVSGAVFNFPATINLLADASDPDGTIAKVEFYQGTTKLGESLTAPFAYTWSGMLPGSYALSAVAYDNQNAKTSTSASLVTVQAALPFSTDFEGPEGYALGSLDGQGGWVATGTAVDTDADHYTGARTASVSATTPAGQVSHVFPPYDGKTMVFADVFAKLVVGADPASSSVIQGEGAKVAFVQNGAQGEIQVFSGDDNGGGAWHGTGFLVPLAGVQSAAWLRITMREDFATKKWDLYVNGRMVAYDLGFTDSTQTVFSKFAVGGSTAGPTLFDSLFIGFDNPLFADVNGDGIDDAWETSHGLPLTTNDRYLAPSGNGVTVVQAYVAGTDPNDYYSGVAPTLTPVGSAQLVARTGLVTAFPLAVSVRNPTTNALLATAPLTFAIDPTSGSLFVTATSPTGSAQLVVRTDANGVARGWFQMVPAQTTTVAVTATAYIGTTAAATATFHLSPVVESTQLATGFDQSLWLDSAGVARAWGRNNSGQLGDGTYASRSQMKRVSTLGVPLVSVAYGQAHGLAVDNLGQVYAWGDDYFGQLGDQLSATRRTPMIVMGLPQIVQVAAGDSHSVALGADGTVWTWGGNQRGQLGDGTHTNRATPQQVAGLPPVLRVVAGARYTLALGADGSVWAWGANDFGQLAITNATDRPAAAPIAGLGNVVSLVAGRQHGLALRNDGVVFTWGDNHAAQLGDGGTTAVAAPESLTSVPFAVGLAAGASDSFALGGDGILRGWGANESGQLGTGNTTASPTPIALTIANVRAFSASADHMIVLHNDGTLQAWGLNTYGQLGVSASSPSNTPVTVAPAVD